MKLILLVSIFFIVLGFIITPSDFSISEKYYNKDATWAILIEKYGEIPGLLVVFIALSMLAFYLLKQPLPQKSTFVRYLACVWRVCLYLGSLVLSVTLLQYIIYGVIVGYSNYHYTHLNIHEQWGTLIFYIALFISLILGSVFAFLTKLNITNHYLFVRIVILQFIISQSFIQIIKETWGRIRFRDLATQQIQLQLPNLPFSPWYIPQDLGGRSFPSGHTGLGWMLLGLFLLISKDCPYFRILVLKTCIIWGLLIVPFSRIILGAHYASDVWAASIFTVMPFIILLKIFEPNTTTNTSIPNIVQDK